MRLFVTSSVNSTREVPLSMRSRDRDRTRREMALALRGVHADAPYEQP
jgi:hypothetical protein